MFIIGGSGLMLWFPEFFSLVLPGTVLNLATLVHGEEALLAVGFIFSIHFFNGHIRPEKFPMDTCMFSGRIPLEELQHERPAEYERLVKEGKLASVLTGAGRALGLDLGPGARDRGGALGARAGRAHRLRALLGRALMVARPVREFLAAVTRSPLGLLGAALTTASAVLFLSLFVIESVGVHGGPYLGIIIFMILPGVFILGLVLMPAGAWLEGDWFGKRRFSPA